MQRMSVISRNAILEGITDPQDIWTQNRMAAPPGRVFLSPTLVYPALVYAIFEKVVANLGVMGKSHLLLSLWPDRWANLVFNRMVLVDPFVYTNGCCSNFITTFLDVFSVPAVEPLGMCRIQRIFHALQPVTVQHGETNLSINVVPDQNIPPWQKRLSRRSNPEGFGPPDIHPLRGGLKDSRCRVSTRTGFLFMHVKGYLPCWQAGERHTSSQVPTPLRQRRRVVQVACRRGPG
mgnify:CR=1 FL=1